MSIDDNRAQKFDLISGNYSLQIGSVRIKKEDDSTEESLVGIKVEFPAATMFDDNVENLELHVDPIDAEYLGEGELRDEIVIKKGEVPVPAYGNLDNDADVKNFERSLQNKKKMKTLERSLKSRGFMRNPFYTVPVERSQSPGKKLPVERSNSPGDKLPVERSHSPGETFPVESSQSPEEKFHVESSQYPEEKFPVDSSSTPGEKFQDLREFLNIKKWRQNVEKAQPSIPCIQRPCSPSPSVSDEGECDIEVLPLTKDPIPVITLSDSETEEAAPSFTLTAEKSDRPYLLPFPSSPGAPVRSDMNQSPLLKTPSPTRACASPTQVPDTVKSANTSHNSIGSPGNFGQTKIKYGVVFDPNKKWGRKNPNMTWVRKVVPNADKWARTAVVNPSQQAVCPRPPVSVQLDFHPAGYPSHQMGPRGPPQFWPRMPGFNAGQQQMRPRGVNQQMVRSPWAAAWPRGASISQQMSGGPIFGQQMWPRGPTVNAGQMSPMSPCGPGQRQMAHPHGAAAYRHLAQESGLDQQTAYGPEDQQMGWSNRAPVGDEVRRCLLQNPWQHGAPDVETQQSVHCRFLHKSEREAESTSDSMPFYS